MKTIAFFITVLFFLIQGFVCLRKTIKFQWFDSLFCNSVY